VAALIEEFVGWLLAGFVIAAIVRPCPPRVKPATDGIPS
jgi:hypothetical protein